MIRSREILVGVNAEYIRIYTYSEHICQRAGEVLPLQTQTYKSRVGFIIYRII